MVGAVGAGTLSLGALTLFLFLGSWSVLDLGLSPTGSLVLDAVLCLVFFLQHSTMIRPTVKRRLARLIPDAYLGAVYTCTSGGTLLLLLVLWQQSPHILIACGTFATWLVRGLFITAGLCFFASSRSLTSLDAFGVKPLTAMQDGIADTHPRFQVRGAYRWLRHPLYACTLLMIWSCPLLTADRLLFNMSFSIWIVVGTVLEERDLVTAFGAEYQQYQAQVPMLVPWRVPAHRDADQAESFKA